jgi:hypothetical protein
MQVKAQCNHEVVTTKAGRAPDPLIPADPLGPALETHKKELFMGAPPVAIWDLCLFHLLWAIQGSQRAVIKLGRSRTALILTKFPRVRKMNCN